jgi:chorismate lyase
MKCPVGAQGYRTWLIDQGSLTARLQRCVDSFSVLPLKSKPAKVGVDECKVLGIHPKRNHFVREVLLMSDATPLVFAHSVLSGQTRGCALFMTKLGNRPLGASLFKNPSICRGPIQYRKLAHHDLLRKEASRHQIQLPKGIWARRSVFYLSTSAQKERILVTEIFLPSVKHLK